MNSYKGVAAAVAHREPDRVPLEYWSVPEVDERLRAEFTLPSVAALQRYLKVDMVRLAPELNESVKRRQADGDWFDEWGARRHWVRRAHGGGYWEWVDFPLGSVDTIAGLRGYRWPRVYMFDWDDYARQLDAHEGLVINGWHHVIFAATWFLRGIENALLDLSLNPEFAHHLIARITDYECELIEKTLDVGARRIQNLITFDDRGMQTGLMMSPAMFPTFYAAPVRRCFELTHEKGVGIFLPYRRFRRRTHARPCGAGY